MRIMLISYMLTKISGLKLSQILNNRIKKDACIEIINLYI